MSKPNVKPHWSFWVICVVALIWNAMGCMNFIMQMNPEMLANFPEAAKSLVATRPIWATAAFALAVFGGLVGDVLLLLRKPIAYYLFIASLLGVIVTNIHTVQVSSDMNIWVGSAMSLAVSTFLIWYTKTTNQKGWLS